MKSAQLNVIHTLLDARKKNPPGSLQEARDGYDDLCSLFAPPAGLVFEEEDLCGVPALRGSEPGYSRKGRTLLYVHGGGFMVGSAKGFSGLAGDLAHKTGVQVFIIDYRLAPENPFPAARDDVLQAYKGLLDSGIAAKDIALVGDSAGAQLILSAMFEAQAEGLPLPCSLLMFSPWIDLSLSGTSLVTKAGEDIFLSQSKLAGCAQAYLGDVATGVNADAILSQDLSGFPPLMIQVGTAEILLDDALRLANRAIEAQVMARLEVWPEMFHVWHAFAPQLQEGSKALVQASQFLKLNFDSES